MAPRTDYDSGMRNFLLGILLTVAVLVVGGYLYFALGIAPVATAAQPMPFETHMAKLALHARINKEMPTVVPVSADASSYAAAVPLYRTHCAVCHGLPGQPRTAIAQGMFPDPPKLFPGKGVSDDPAGETYWKVTNGIRLTGMPAFEKTLSDTQRWQLSVMLAHSNQLPPAILQALSAPLPQQP